MVAGAGGVSALPQLHVDGKVPTMTPDADEVRQIMGPPWPAASIVPVSRTPLRPVSQFLGDADAVQELEDAGELQALLQGSASPGAVEAPAS